MNKNVNDLGKVILKKKIYIILITLIFAITGVVYTLANVKYVATQKFLLQDAESQQLSATYQEIIKGSTLLNEVIQNLDENISVSELSNLVEVNVIEDTNMLEINVIGEDEEKIKSYSDEISKVFVTTVDKLYDNAEIYNVDASEKYYNCGNVAIVGIVSLFAGFVISTGLFVMSFLLDNKVKYIKDVEDITGLKPLILIPNIKGISKKKLNIKTIRAHKSEIFKLLMTNIQFVNSNNLKSKSIMITSPNPFEGKTYVATNLAIEFAKVGKKVILIDGDMRRGRVSKIFNLPNDLGFSNYLSNLDANGNNINERITRFINDTEIKNLNVITSGNMPPNPTELMRKEKISELIKDLKVFYDVIIFDTVSILEAPEAIKLSEVCDLSLIMSAYGNTKKEDLTIAYEQLSVQNGSVIGMILNKTSEKKMKKKVIKFNSKLKKNISNIVKNVKKAIVKLKNVLKIFRIVGGFFDKSFGGIKKGFIGLNAILINSINNVKLKTQSVKDQIKKYKAKREKIKLIEAGSIIPDENNNIIKEVFEDKIAQLENPDEIKYQEKLDNLKNNIDEKKDEIIENPVRIRNTVTSNNHVKSKFDLMLEQQEKDNSEIEEKDDISSIDKQEELKKQEEIRKKEELIQKQRIEREQAEERKRQEEIKRQEMELLHQAELRKIQEEKQRQEEIEKNQNLEIDDIEGKSLPENILNEEILTEEMIKYQVEMDEFARLLELEEEQKINAIKQKEQEKLAKKQERKEKIEKIKENGKMQFANLMQNLKDKREKQAEINSKKREIKMEEKNKKDREKIENRERIAKVKEEKRAFKELEKEKHREEARIREEIQEDNLYPKPKM